MTAPPGLAIRRMALDDAAWMMDMAAAEGWNPGLNDAALFFETDPRGFFVAELDGERVGCLAGVAYDDSYGFLGGYIVAPEHRGENIGIALWREATAYLGDRNVGLDGVIEQQENYRRSGFTLAYRQIRHEGEAGGPGGGPTVPLATVPFAQVVEYDARHFPVRREDFLRRWVNDRHCAVRAVTGQAGELRGFGVLRQCREGAKVGPLFADGPGEAEAILADLLALAPAGPVYLDTPEANPEAVALARRFGMSPVFETARMYNRGDPGFRVEGVFGVTTFELG